MFPVKNGASSAAHNITNKSPAMGLLSFYSFRKNAAISSFLAAISLSVNGQPSSAPRLSGAPCKLKEAGELIGLVLFISTDK